MRSNRTKEYGTLLIKRVSKVATVALFLSSGPSVCLPVRPHVSGRLLLDAFTLHLILGTCMEICREIPNLVKNGQNIEHILRRPKYVLLFPATLNRHKSALF